MRRIVIIALVSMLALMPAIGCSTSPSRKSSATVRVAALTFPGGGAPPAILSLYQAALEVNRNTPDLDIKVVTVSPQQPEPGMMMEPQNAPPTVSALEQALGQDPPPDVVLFSSTYEFSSSIENDLLQPLDNFVRSDRNVKQDDYFPGALDVLRDRDRLYGLPVAVAPTVMMYDKRVFDDAGVPVPESSWDWSTFLGLARQVTKAKDDPQNDVYALNLAGPLLLPAFIWQNGGDLVSKDGLFYLLNEPAALEAVKFYYDLMNTYKVVPPMPKPGDKMSAARAPMMTKPVPVKPGEVPPIFGPGGRVAMQIMTNAGSPYMGFPFSRGGDRPIRLVELPRGKVHATLMDVQVAIAMTGRAQDGPLAYKAMVALAEEMQKSIAVPARRSLAKKLREINPNLAEEDVPVILNSLEYARALPFFISGKSDAMRVFYEKLLNPLQQGTKSPEEAVKEASDALDEVLNKQ
ncbi:MAG: extracellular solute-binding protein [Chloroflexi bacterium]|nr:extracellular solute-binding protein [Chloroflexota bacterium]